MLFIILLLFCATFVPTPAPEVPKTEAEKLRLWARNGRIGGEVGRIQEAMRVLDQFLDRQQTIPLFVAPPEKFPLRPHLSGIRQADAQIWNSRQKLTLIKNADFDVQLKGVIDAKLRAQVQMLRSNAKKRAHLEADVAEQKQALGAKIAQMRLEWHSAIGQMGALIEHTANSSRLLRSLDELEAQTELDAIADVESASAQLQKAMELLDQEVAETESAKAELAKHVEMTEKEHKEHIGAIQTQLEPQRQLVELATGAMEHVNGLMAMEHTFRKVNGELRAKKLLADSDTNIADWLRNFAAFEQTESEVVALDELRDSIDAHTRAMTPAQAELERLNQEHQSQMAEFAELAQKVEQFSEALVRMKTNLGALRDPFDALGEVQNAVDDAKKVMDKRAAETQTEIQELESAKEKLLVPLRQFLRPKLLLQKIVVLTERLKKGQFAGTTALYNQCLYLEELADRDGMQLDKRALADGKGSVRSPNEKNVINEWWAYTFDRTKGVKDEAEFKRILAYRMGQLNRLVELKSEFMAKQMQKAPPKLGLEEAKAELDEERREVDEEVAKMLEAAVAKEEPQNRQKH